VVAPLVRVELWHRAARTGWVAVGHINRSNEHKQHRKDIKNNCEGFHNSCKKTRATLMVLAMESSGDDDEEEEQETALTTSDYTPVPSMGNDGHHLVAVTRTAAAPARLAVESDETVPKNVREAFSLARVDTNAV
jgi:hypothetical protein